MAKGFCDVITNADRCCCENLRALDGIKFQNCQDTGAIIGAINSASQRQIDWLTCNELKEANEKIAALRSERDKVEIIAAMKPVAPVPAYIQANPFENFRPVVRCEPDGRFLEGRPCGFDGRF